MRKLGFKSYLLLASLMAISGCSKADSQVSSVAKEASFSFKGFHSSKHPFVYLTENTKYVPVTIEFGDVTGNLDINEFSLASTKPVSIFKDSNNNNVLDENERSSLKEVGTTPTSVTFVADDSFSATYLLYEENGFEDDTLVSFSGSANGKADGKDVIVSSFEEGSCPTSVVLLYDKPEEHITVTELSDESVLYQTNFTISNDDTFSIVSIENAVAKEGNKYTYKGLDGEITIKYAVNIKDKYYSSKSVFGEGEYKVKLNVIGHDHIVSEPTSVSGMKDYSCDCGVFHAYELDSSNAKDPTVPDLNNPAEMMGNQMFRIEWNVTGIQKGRYKAYVHGSTKDSQKDLKWFTLEESETSHCPSYIRINEAEEHPCTDKTFGETFGEGTNWRWTSSPIFEFDVPEGLTELSIQSGNNNGRLNDYNMFVRGLLLVPYSEDFSPLWL